MGQFGLVNDVDGVAVFTEPNRSMVLAFYFHFRRLFLLFGKSLGLSAVFGKLPIDLSKKKTNSRRGYISLVWSQIISSKENRGSPGLYTIEDARQLARRRLPRMMFDFVDGAAGYERSLSNNEAAFDQVKFQPRVLNDVRERSLRKEFLGRQWGLPFGIAPMGMCNLTWPHADKMLSSLAVEKNFPHGLSTAASTTLEESYKQAGSNAWFQLYVGPTEELSWEMMERAQSAGFDTLVFTVDVPVISRRVRDLRNGFQVPFKIGLKQFIDFATHPYWSIASLMAGPPKPMNFETSKSGRGFVRGASRAGADWDYLKKLRERWRGKLIVKGLLSAEDSVSIKNEGADAIYVSNHGGRQLDGVMAALEALPQIRKAVGPDYPLLFDSGVRSGEDIAKALALGADFVMLGRPFLYAIGADGARGLNSLIEILEEELLVVLAQLGLNSIEEITPAALANRKQLGTGKS